MHRRRIITGTAALPLALVFGTLPASAQKAAVYTGILSNTAVGGYDPVSYFTEGRPVRGQRAHQISWQGVTWLFSSAANADAFRADPERFAPVYGGYCAYGVSQNSAVKGDPEFWTIHEDRLYLNITRQVQDLWLRDIPGHIARADRNWPAVLG